MTTCPIRLNICHGIEAEVGNGTSIHLDQIWIDPAHHISLKLQEEDRFVKYN
jgi:hypothetical protein